MDFDAFSERAQPYSGWDFQRAGNGGRFILLLPRIGTVLGIQPNEDLRKGAPPVPLYADRNAIDRLVRQLVAAQSSYNNVMTAEAAREPLSLNLRL